MEDVKWVTKGGCWEGRRFCIFGDLVRVWFCLGDLDGFILN